MERSSRSYAACRKVAFRNPPPVRDNGGVRHLLSVLLAAALVLVAAPPAEASNDPSYNLQWSIPLIGADGAWATGREKGITIAVVDTGVDLEHEDLKGKLRPGLNLVSPGALPQDDNGHGTHVAGIAAAFADNGKGIAGVARDASIMPVKVLDEDGLGAANVDDGIRWAVDNGAHIVNLSLGALLEPVSGAPFVEAIEYAWSKGVICVIAAGNDYVTTSAFDHEPAVIVTATTKDDTKPDYATSVRNADWGMAAPGGASTVSLDFDDIYSTYWRARQRNAYAYLTGTSMAAPHVAGAAAILRGLGLTPQQTVDRLLATAKDIGSPGRDDFGAGRLDLAKAVSGLKATGGTGSGSGAASAAGAAPSTSVDRSPSGGGVRTSVAGRPTPQGIGETGPASASHPGSGTTIEESDNSAGGGPSQGSSEAAAQADPAADSELPWGPPLAAAGLAAAVALAAFKSRRAPAPRRRSTSD